MSTVSVFRDDCWQKIPLNHLVEEDIVGLVHSEIAPVKLRCIEPGKKFKKIKLFKSNQNLLEIY